MKYKNLLSILSNFKIKYTIFYIFIIILLLFSLIYFLTSILFFCVNIWDKNTNKFTLNSYFPQKNKLKTQLFDIHNLPDMSYPYIIKPTICSGTSKNVSLIHNDKDLYNFIIKYNPNEKYIVQEFYKSKNEIGVLYEKIPYINNGNIISIVSKKNDTNDWKPLKCGNIKNGENVQCEDLTNSLDYSKFSDIIKNISSGIPGFNAGRYDIGFENVHDLNNGNFKIYELNGVMGYDLRSNMTANESISALFLKLYYFFRWASIRYLIGFINIFSLKISPFYVFDKYPTSISNCIQCSDWEHLFQPSPA
jgi:hypothetical protein